MTSRPKGLIGLIEYLFQQVITFFPEANLQRTLRLSVLGSEKFGDGSPIGKFSARCKRRNFGFQYPGTEDSDQLSAEPMERDTGLRIIRSIFPNKLSAIRD